MAGSAVAAGGAADQFYLSNLLLQIEHVESGSEVRPGAEVGHMLLGVTPSLHAHSHSLSSAAAAIEAGRSWA